MLENSSAQIGNWKIRGMLIIPLLFFGIPLEARGEKLSSKEVHEIIRKLSNGDPEGQIAFDRLKLLLMEQNDSKSVADVATYLLDEKAGRRLDLLWLLLDVSDKHPKSLTSAIDIMIRAFPSFDSTQQHVACRLLASIPDRNGKVAAFLRHIVKNYDSESKAYVRSYAAGALLKVVPEDNEALGFLVRLSASSSADDQIRAAYAMQYAGTRAAPALPILRALMKSRDSAVRVVSATAALSAGATTDEVVPILRESLRQKGNSFFVEPMYFGAMQLAPNPSRWSANALGGIGPAAEPAVEDLLVVLQTDDDLLFRTAADALGRIGSNAKAAIPTLLRMLDTETRPQRRREISQTLSKIRPQTIRK